MPLSPHLTRDHQLWRLVLHHFAFANSTELFLGVLLLFYTSIAIERLFGSLKYGVSGGMLLGATPEANGAQRQSFLVATTALSTVLEVVVLLVGSRFGFTTIPAGPFAIIFAIVYVFLAQKRRLELTPRRYQSTRLIPSSFHWKVFGMEITNRIALYILASQVRPLSYLPFLVDALPQLISSQPPASVLVSLIGLLSSTLYRSPLLSLSSFRLPPRLVLLLTRAFSPLLGSSPPPRRPNAASFGEGVQEIQVAFPGAFAASTAAVRGFQAQGGAARRPPAATGPAVQVQGPGLVQQWTEGVTGAQRQPTAQ